MLAPKARARLIVRRFKDFMGMFVRNRRGMLGVGIMVFFITLAAVGPLLAPYDPILYLPRIAERFAKPIWYKYLPGAEDLSENLKVINEPGLDSPASLQDLTFTTNSSSQRFSTFFASGEGSPGSERGCVGVTFKREDAEVPSGKIEVCLVKGFNYPYKVPPIRFSGDMAALVKAVKNVSIEITVFIEQSGGNRTDWWSQEFKSPSATWMNPQPPVDSYAPGVKWQWGGADPAAVIFSKPGDYIFGVEMLFNDDQPGASAEATVYIDNLYLTLFGSAFGLLGTDQLGRDIFTQLVYGARISLIVGFLAAFLSTSIGLIIGLVAGYIGKIIDQILMRFTDIVLSIPDVPLLIVILAVFRGSIWIIVLLLGILYWTSFARVVRSETLSLKERSFIEAAKAVGGGRFYIIRRHILPNVMSLVYVSLALSVPNAIISEAWLSWLGLYDPTVMTWGRMLHDVQNTTGGIQKWWWILPPGLCIAAISLSFILVGYALDEVLNPKLRKRR